MAADHDVVGDLHQVVDLGALADHRVRQRAPVDRGVGADLHVVADDDAADLGHLHAALGATMAKPKPSWPMRAPAWMMTPLPTTAWVKVAPAPT